MKKHDIALAVVVSVVGPLVSGRASAQLTGPAGGARSAPSSKPSPGAPSSGGGKGPDLSVFEEAVEFAPRSPSDKVAFSLDDADLAELVRVISQLTGKRFIFGAKIKDIKASVYAPQKVTVAEAYQAFLSILETNKLTVVPHGRFLKIVESGAVAANGSPVYGTHEPAPAEDRYITRMHRLGNISADDAAAVLAKLKTKDADITVYGPTNLLIITDTGTNIRRMMKVLEEIDEPSSGDWIYIEPIHYASADEIKMRLEELFETRASGRRRRSPTRTPRGAAPSGRADGCRRAAICT